MLDTLAVLEQCRVRLLSLDDQVERIRSTSVSRQSESDVTPVVPPPSPAMMTGDTVKRSEARCHECHGPVANYHKGHPHGVDICNLEHYDLCAGDVVEGKDKGGHFWRGCPDGFAPHPDRENLLENINSEEQTFVSPSDNSSLNSSDSSSATNDPTFKPGPGFEAPTGGGVQTRTGGASAIQDDLLGSKLDHTGGVTPGHQNSLPRAPPSSKSKEEKDLLLEAEIAEIDRIERETKLLSIQLRKQKAQDDYDRLRRQALGEGARQKTTQDNLHRAVDGFRAQNSEQQFSGADMSGYRGPTIGQIRKDPSTCTEVNDLMDDVYRAPVFSHVQSRLGKPRIKQPSNINPAPTVHQPRMFNAPSLPSPDKMFKWVTCVDRHGEEYKTLEEVTPPPRQPVQPRARLVVQTKPGWYYDDQSGRMYRAGHQSRSGHVRTDADNTSVHPGQYHHCEDKRRSVSTPVRQSRQNNLSPKRPAVRRRDSSDRVPHDTYSEHMDEREGKPMSIVCHARTLPVESAKSVTSKNLSFAAFIYGAVRELHSSLTGLASPMDQDTMEAKLQHVMNVVHVTCLNAAVTDFKPVAWTVGRTYHNLVQAKVDLGRESWADFNVLYRGSPHAAEMVAAEREHRALLNRPPPKQAEKVGKGGEKAKKPLCSTWNDSETEGKCKWEIDNPGLACNRSHHCSYCEKKGNPKTFHQERFCKRKLAEDK